MVKVAIGGMTLGGRDRGQQQAGIRAKEGFEQKVRAELRDKRQGQEKMIRDILTPVRILSPDFTPPRITQRGY